jgi:type VI secretion system protein VasG
MAHISRRTLFGKLNAFCFSALENGTAYCKLRGHSYVELVHWIYQILDAPASDFLHMLRAAKVDAPTLARDVTRALDRLPRGATAISDFSPHLEEAGQEAWIVATLGFSTGRIRSGHLLLGCLMSRSLRNALVAISPELGKLSADGLRGSFDSITAGSPEAETGIPLDAASLAHSGNAAPPVGGGALARYAIDLTARARAGELDPVIGRDAEIRQVIDILLRRRQNNPILTGEAGVGKTAIVEGLACRIVADEVPPALRQVTLQALDLGLLQAGAGVKGEFEERLRQVIEEVQTQERPVILFIDEAHTLIGAGGQEGTGDAANLLKPALARGTLRTIAATTWSEYKRHIEKDPALTRRFQPILVNEPDETQAIAMMRRMAQVLERHHGVEITDDAVTAAVTLSHRYIPARQLPDKSLSLLDTACARVAVSRHAPPSEIEHQRQAIKALELELEILDRQAADGEDTGEQRRDTEACLTERRGALEALEARWREEAALVDRIRTRRTELREIAMALGDQRETPALDAVPTLRELEQRRLALARDRPLVRERVDRAAVAAIVQDWTGIPVGRLLKSEAATLLSLADTLSHRVIGQDHAMEAIAGRIQTSRAGLDDPDKPIGVFLLCGPSGVGKTETAIALAEHLEGGENSLITINMSEFQEAHSVSLLKGAPPGYVGYGQGGRLTEAVRRRPHAIVLLDEIEKAHPDVHEIFFQVFDKGAMEDGEGRRIDFRNTLILMTSNVGAEEIGRLCPPGEKRPAPEKLEKAIRRPLLEVFSPALLGRMIPLPYYPMSEQMLDRIVRLRLRRIADRLMGAHGVDFSHSEAAVRLIIERVGQIEEAGGRAIDGLLTHTILPMMSRRVFSEQLEGRSIGPIRLDADADAADFVYEFSGLERP